MNKDKHWATLVAQNPNPDPGGPHMPQSNEAHEPQILSLCSGDRKPQLLKPKCPRAQAL